MKKFTPFFALIAIGFSLSAMEYGGDIENQLSRIQPESDTEFSDHIPIARRIERHLLVESNSYDQFLQKITQEPNPHIKEIISQWVKDDTDEWHDAIETTNYSKIQQLFETLSRRLQHMCNTSAALIPVFHISKDDFNKHWSLKVMLKQETITRRSFNADFVKQLRIKLDQGNHTANQELSINFKKWYLYFDHFEKKALSKGFIQHTKQLSTFIIPISLGLCGLMAAQSSPTSPEALTLIAGLYTTGAAAIALQKKDICSAQQAIIVQTEIQDMLVRFKTFSETLMQESKKIECEDMLYQAIDALRSKKQYVPHLQQRLTHWNELYNQNMIPELEKETQTIVQEIDARI